MQLSLTLAVTDLERTEDFYRELLGMKPQRLQTAGFAPYLLLRCGTCCIVFRPAEVLEAEHPALLQNLDRQPLGVGVQLELSCEDLAAVRRNIDRYAWPVSYELEDAEHQRSEIWLHDPDGYLLVLNEEKFVDSG
jgi:catechol 2,3-dioxygenase-like lactoylglutathione lyase family enzyme